MSNPTRRPVWFLLGFLLTALACGSDSLTGTAAEGCGPPPWFTVLPVAFTDIDAIAPIGGLGAPGHTLPTAHTGFLLSREGAPVSAPGPMQITGLRRTTYVVSPNRQGEQDFTAEFQVCREVSGWFGHLTSLASPLGNPPGGWSNCQQYSTATETVETCSATLSNVTMTAGQPLGTGGLSIAQGLMGLDIGLLDSRVNNFYVARWRHPSPSIHSTCPWDKFSAGLTAQLYSKLVDKGRPGMVAGGEPQCGTMEVDVAGTAKGIWAEPSETQPVAGNETRYITLANYPFRPQDYLALSLGPASLGGRVAVVARQASGRVNRAFEQVTSDGLIYCYGPDAQLQSASWLLSLTGASALTVRQVVHAAGASPCLGDPATWSIAGGLAMVR